MSTLKQIKAKVNEIDSKLENKANDASIDVNKFTFYQRKDKNILDVDYNGKPLTFTFKGASGSGISEGRGGKSKYIRFTIPYEGDNIKTFENYKDCYAYICTVQYIQNIEDDGSSFNDLIKDGSIIIDPFNIYNKEALAQGDKFTIFITIFDNTRIKGVDMKSIVNTPFECDLTLRLTSVTGISKESPGRLNFQISEMTIKRMIQKIEREVLRYDMDMATKLFNNLKVKSTPVKYDNNLASELMNKVKK